MRDENNGSNKMPMHVGDIVAGKYEILSVLGFGAFAWVYRARHTLVSSLDVAVKVLRPEHLHETDTLRRFHQEAETAARLKSRFTTKITDFGITESGSPFLVMDFIEGLSLEAYLRQAGPLSTAAAARWAIQVLRALEEAHGVGIVHRDLKPANIYVVEDPDGEGLDIRVLDFGIAKIMDRTKRAAETTATGQLFCSPRYASPELLRGNPSPQSDIYALGITLCELLDGKVPYPEPDFFSVAARHLADEPVPLGPNAEASPLAKVLKRSLAKPLEQRFESAREMRKELEVVLDIDKHDELPTPADLRHAKIPAPGPVLSSRNAESQGEPNAAQSTLISPADHAALMTLERAIERVTASPPVVPEKRQRQSSLVPLVLALLILSIAAIVLVKSGTLSSSKTSAPNAPPSEVPERPPPLAVEEVVEEDGSGLAVSSTAAVDAETAQLVAEARGASRAVGIAPIAREVCNGLAESASEVSAGQPQIRPVRPTSIGEETGGTPEVGDDHANPDAASNEDVGPATDAPPDNPFAGQSLMGGR